MAEAEFSGMYIREFGDSSGAYDCAWLDENGTIAWEAWDGKNIRSFKSDSVQIQCRANGSSQFRTVFEMREIKTDVMITDARIVLRVEQYNQSFRNAVGLGALAFQGVSRLVDRARRKGTTLIGHYRYEWIANVAYRSKTGFLSDEQLILMFVTKQKDVYKILIRLKKNEGPDYANDILQRLGSYRLQMKDEKKPEELKFFAEAANGKGITPTDDPKNKTSQQQIPTYYYYLKGEEFRPDPE